MKKLLLISSASILSFVSYSQYVYKIKADSVLITNDSCNAELNIENSTRNICGFLFNKGNGRTEFRSALIKLNDSTYVSGCDTLRLQGGGAVAFNGLSNAVTGTDSVQLGGTLTKNDTIVAGNKRMAWTFNTLAGASGFDISSTSTAAASNAQKLVNISLSGTNSNASQTTYGIYVSNTHRGNTPSNFGLYSTVSGGGSGDISVYGNSDYIGVEGNGNSFGVYGNTANGFALFGNSSGSSGHGLQANSTDAEAAIFQRYSLASADSNTVVRVVNQQRYYGSGIAANGIGSSYDFSTQLISGALPVSNQIISKWTDASDTYTSEFDITGVSNGTLQNLLSLGGNGLVTLSQYTSGNFYQNDTSSYKPLVVDASGNIYQSSWLGGGGGEATTIYTGDGSLPSDRTVDLNGHELIFSNTGTKYIDLQPSNGAIVLTSPLGRNITVSDDASAVTIAGDNQLYTLNSSGHTFNGNVGVGITPTVLFEVQGGSPTPGDPQIYISTSNYQTFFSASDGTAETFLNLYGNSSGPAQFSLFASNGTNPYINISGDANAQTITMTATNGVILSGYGSGTHIGTATHGLAVDASGNIIEMTLAEGGGGDGSTIYTSNGTYLDSQNRTIDQNGFSTTFINGSFGVGATPTTFFQVHSGGDFDLQYISIDTAAATRNSQFLAYNPGNNEFSQLKLFANDNDGYYFWLSANGESTGILGDGNSNQINYTANTHYFIGDLTLALYGTGSHTGTVAYNLAVDASGNIIETTGGGGGTTIYTGDGTITDGSRNVDLFTNNSNLYFLLSSNSSSSLALHGGDGSDRTLIFNSADASGTNSGTFVGWGYDQGGIQQIVYSYDSTSRNNVYRSYDGANGNYAELQLKSDLSSGHYFWLNINGEGGPNIFGNIDGTTPYINYNAGINGTHNFTGNFSVQGGNISLPVTTITNNNYTVNDGDYDIIFVLTDGNYAITLPDATLYAGRHLNIITSATNSSNILTVNTVSSQLINDISSGSYSMGRGQSLGIFSDGVNWFELFNSTFLD